MKRFITNFKGESDFLMSVFFVCLFFFLFCFALSTSWIEQVFLRPR